MNVSPLCLHNERFSLQQSLLFIKYKSYNDEASTAAGLFISESLYALSYLDGRDLYTRAGFSRTLVISDKVTVATSICLRKLATTS